MLLILAYYTLLEFLFSFNARFLVQAAFWDSTLHLVLFLGLFQTGIVLQSFFVFRSPNIVKEFCCSDILYEFCDVFS